MTLTNYIPNQYKTLSPSTFGSSMPGYSYKVDSANRYRFGFNGQEFDNGFGEFYSFEYRTNNARIGRFLSVDPLSNGYPYNSVYCFAENQPIWAMELEGLEAYYSANGRKLADDEVKVLGKEIDKDNHTVIILNIGQKEDGNGKKNPYLIEENNLNISENDFLSYAGWVNNETYSTYRGGSVIEKFALSSAIKNWAESENESVPELLNTKLDKTDRIDKGYKGKTYRQVYLIKLANASDADRESAISGVINALIGGMDYSYGATQWDGIEQAHTDGKTCKGTYEYHCATEGWTISDEHYTKWKANITEYHGEAYFKAPQHSLAKSCTKAKENVGLMRLKSAACYGTTIFWTVRNLEDSNTEHNGKHDKK